MRQLPLNTQGLSLVILIIHWAVQPSATMAQTAEIQATPATTGTPPSLTNPHTQGVQTRPRTPANTAISPQHQTAMPLTVNECTKLGGSVTAEPNGLCKTGLKCSRWDDRASVTRHVCIDKIIEP